MMSVPIVRRVPPSRDEECWNKVAETLQRTELRELQEKRIRALTPHVYDNSGLYRSKFKEAGINTYDIKTLDDLRKIPITVKDDVRNYRTKTGDPYGGMLCVSEQDVFIIHSSTGTTGIPTLIPITRHDYEFDIEHFTRLCWAAGLRPGEKAFVNHVRFHPGGTTMDSAVERIGAISIKSDIYPLPPLVGRAIFLSQLLKPTLFIPGVMSFLMLMEEETKKRGLEPAEVFGCYKGIAHAGEPLSPTVRKKIDTLWNTKLYNFAGLGDFNVYWPECRESSGMHVWDDMNYVEIIDPETKETVGPGERGEIVVTTLWRGAIPAFRWGIEDIGELNTEVCDCGRTSARINVLGRVTQVLNVKEKKILAIDIENVLRAIPETESGIFQVIKYAPEMDSVRVRVAPEEIKDPVELKGRIGKAISKALGVNADIEFVDKVTIYSDVKVSRFVDLTKD